MAKISTTAPRLDHFFSAVAARLDLWRDVSRAAQAWAATPASRGDAGLQAACNEALTALLPMEAFQAYPGGRLLNAIKERVAAGDALGTARLVQRVSSALMSRSYRSDAGEWEAEDDAPAAERAMPTAHGESAGATLLRGVVRDAHATLALGRTRAADPEAAAQPGPVRLRAGVRRLVRGRGAGRDPQHQPRVGGDLRRLPLRVVARRAAAEERAVVQAVARPEGPRVGRQRPDAGGGREALPAGARHHPARRQEARGDDRRPGGRGNPPHLLRGRGAARDPPLDPLRRRRAQRDAVLRQPEEVRAEAGRHLPRAAGGARQVDLQVELDPRHGRVLRGQPVPRGILGDDRRPGQPARAHRQHQEGAGRGRARLRRRPRVLRDQRHLDLEQDGPPGAARAGRHRDRRPQLPQVAPLRHGAGRRAALLRRGLPDGGVLDVRRGAAAQPQEGAARPQGGGPARQGEDGHADQLHLRRPRLRRAPRDGRVPGDQAGPDLPLGRGVVRLRPLLAALPPAHRDGRARGPEGGLRRPRVPGALPRAGEDARRGPRPQGRARARHPAHPGSAQGQAARLPDQLDAQVDVRAAAGLDGAGGRRGLPPARAGLQGGGVHPRLDVAQPADHRLARRGAPADGAGGLRAGHAGDPARDRDPRAR